MATKEENRAKLKRLEAIVNSKLATFVRWGTSTGDTQVSQVVTRLREALDEIDPPLAKRGRASGYDRIARGGRDREG